MITQDELKENLFYDKETGIFYWNKGYGKNGRTTDIAGNLNSQGYVNIKIKGKIYKAHRLAWVYIYGNIIKTDIDHINCDKSDNRIINLRLATRSQNQFNRGKTIKNTSGFKGVSWYKKGSKWMSYCYVNGKRKHLGYFHCINKAYDAFLTFSKTNNLDFHHN